MALRHRFRLGGGTDACRHDCNAKMAFNILLTICAPQHVSKLVKAGAAASQLEAVHVS